MKANLGQRVVYLKDGAEDESKVIGVDFGFVAGYRLENGDWVAEVDGLRVMPSA